jgi:hypothetical protein
MYIWLVSIEYIEGLFAVTYTIEAGNEQNQTPRVNGPGRTERDVARLSHSQALGYVMDLLRMSVKCE